VLLVSVEGREAKGMQTDSVYIRSVYLNRSILQPHSAIFNNTNRSEL
jgi:hypothetical protein